MKKTIIILLVTLIAASSIYAAIEFNAQQMAENAQQAKPNPEVIYPEVGVVTVTPQDYQSQVSGYGEAKAHFELDLKSEVSGQVLELSGRFDNGKRVKKGEQLLVVDDNNYRMAVTDAEAALASANQSLLEEKRQHEQVRLEWKNSGLSGEPSSPLVLREPQMAVAKTTYEQARQSLENAKRDLSKTRISAPFDALVISRDVDVGSYLQTGDSIASLYSTDKIEISIPLSHTKWRNLGLTLSTQNQDATRHVTLTSVDGLNQWQAYIERVEQHYDQTTRQRSLIVAVDQPLEQTPPLYPNAYVKAVISGKNLKSVLRLPQTAISQNQEVWHVDETMHLRKQRPVKVFEDHEYVYIEALSDKPLQIVVRPLNNYIEGARVTPLSEQAQTLALGRER